MLDGLRSFAPAGIWLDYLTYAGWFEEPNPDLQESCFCPGCIAEFCEATGIDATAPEQILSGHAAAWARHKCERIAALRGALCGADPGAPAGLHRRRVHVPWMPDEFDAALTRIFAQDYALLAPAIDVFTPLIYAQKSGRPPGWGRQFLEAAAGFIPPNRKVQLILDALDFPDSLLAAAESEQPSWGIQLFGGASALPRSGSGGSLPRRRRANPQQSSIITQGGMSDESTRWLHARNACRKLV